jgi:glycerate 2-kinase
MPRIIVAPDSFKGTLTAQQAAIALAKGLRQALPAATVMQCPLADGGEGTLDSLQDRLKGTRHSIAVSSAVGGLSAAPVLSCVIEGKSAVVLEAATVVGLTDTVLRCPIQHRTTLGLGQLLQWVLGQASCSDISKIYVGLGGSCTNDGGAGLLVGLGARLLDSTGSALAPTPEGLAQLAAVDLSGLDRHIFDREIVLLSDVDSPLCGPQGATHTFGLQKGLMDPTERDLLDRSLARYAGLAETALIQHVPGHEAALGTHSRPGAGAAGGLGFALQLLGATYQSGAALIAAILGLPELLEQSDWLITGEGCSDRQTLAGKAPWVAAQMAHGRNVPVTLLSGTLGSEDLGSLRDAFGDQCYSLAPGPKCCFTVPEAPATAQDCQEQAADWMTKAGVVLGQQWTRSIQP